MFEAEIYIENNKLHIENADYDVTSFVEYVAKQINDATDEDESVRDTIASILQVGAEQTGSLIYSANARAAMKDHLSEIETIIVRWAEDTGEQDGMQWEYFDFAGVFYKAFNRVVCHISDELGIDVD